MTSYVQDYHLQKISETLVQASMHRWIAKPFFCQITEKGSAGEERDGGGGGGGHKTIKSGAGGAIKPLKAEQK